MSLLEKFQNLDDKTFEELVKEARTLIPQYASGWTDHNIHDPGITFIELFAWLAEMQIYQLNRVTDASYRKFLELVGLYPFDAQPSRMDIIFKNVKDEKKIEAGTQVIGEAGTEKIIFETEEDFNLIPLEIKSVITTQDSLTTDNTDASEKENIFFSAFGEKAGIGAALELGFDKPLPEKEIQISIILFEKDLPPLDTSGDEPVPSVSAVWEYFKGGSWNTLPIKKDTTLALTRSGRIVFDGPSSMEKKDKYYWIRCHLKEGRYEIAPLVEKILLNTVSAVQIETVQETLGKGLGTPEQKFKFKKKPIIKMAALTVGHVQDWQGLLKIFKDQVKSDMPSPGKRIWNMFDQNTRNLINEWSEDQIPGSELKHAVVASINKLLESRDLFDEGSFRDIKLPYERKKLIKSLNIVPDSRVRELNRFLIETAYPDKIKAELLIQVQTKNYEWENWVEVNDLESSAPDDPHYVLDPEEGEITFGNGLNGRIPLKEQEIKVRYKTTRGSAGNVPAGLKFAIDNGGSGRIFGKNMEEAAGGKSAESIEQAKDRAKKDFRTISRAITSKDYEDLALSTPGLRVARAEAIPNYDPDYPCVSIPGTVTVVAVPQARGERVTPVPGKGFLQTVLNHLEMKRLVTTDVHVIGPEYVKVSVMCRIRIKKKSSETEVEKRVREKLEGFLDPLKGGPDGNGWSFGRAVYASEIYQIIDNVEGVEYATSVFLSAENPNGDYQKAGQLIKIPPFALVFSGEHRVITTDLPLEFIKISVKCEINVSENNNSNEVKRRIHKALERFLDPLKGGLDGKGWQPGKAVFASEIEKIIKKIEGVAGIAEVSLCREGEEYRKYSIKIPEDALVISGEHLVEIINRGKI